MRESWCMHAIEDRDNDITNMHANFKIKNSVDTKPSIQNKFRLHQYVSHHKILKTIVFVCKKFLKIIF